MPSSLLVSVVGALGSRAKDGHPPLDARRRDGGGRKWLVAPYSVRDWVRNSRAAGEVTLSRGGHSATYRATEVGPPGAVPVLRRYIRDIKITRPYFDASPDSPDEVIAADAKNHPVFRLDPPSG